jgi:hypothetical protein
MAEFEFTLVIVGDLADEDAVRSLFDAGCNDATFGIIDGMGYGEFAREAPSLAEAALSAIHQVESVASLQVLRVEPDDIVTMADIADRLERSRESVRLLIAGRRGPGGFPPPISHGVERGRLWRWSDVARWFERLAPDEIDAAHFVAAVNATLELRRHLPVLNDSIATKELQALL